MTINELNTKRAELLNEANELSAQKKSLYGNCDITSPMSEDEKELTNKVAALFSEINQINIQKQELLRS